MSEERAIYNPGPIATKLANEGLSFDRVSFERTANNRVRLHYIKDGIGVIVTHDYDLFVSDSVTVPATGRIKVELTG